MMKQSVRRLLYSAGAVTAVGAAVCGQGAVASAANSAPAVPAARQLAASQAAYVPPSQPLYFGEKGAAVKSVQRRLAQLKYYPGPIDGQYGQDVLEAAWAFREVQGLPMNASTAAQPITRAFERDLVNPRQPWRLIRKHAPKTRIEINQHIEVLVFYKNGKVADIFHVSTGGGYYYPCPGDPSATCGPAITPDGNYTALYFYLGWETVPLGTMYNPVYFYPGYAIHGDIPVPWYPASHGCVRIWMDAAAWFYTKLSIGGAHPTPIYIRGVAPYQPGIVG
jgi:peptidoglycan hydrolase-like protein with peptidoglycan-binding domain